MAADCSLSLDEIKPYDRIRNFALYAQTLGVLENESARPENTQLKESAPRTRGAGPSSTAHCAAPRCCSPHARGWPSESCFIARRLPLLPARAGLAPTGRTRCSGPSPAPRTRGAGPGDTITWKVATACSPAHAGLVPASDSAPASRRAAPRTRGAGPDHCAFEFTSERPRARGAGPELFTIGMPWYACSPHARG